MQIFLFLLCLLSTSFLASENKIIFLISTPRSLSVGFLRMMEARQDFEVFNELTNAPYVALYDQKYYEQTFREDCFKSYEEVTQFIFKQAGHSNVFVKEMAFAVPEFLTPDNWLLCFADFVFLVRKPQDVILSLYQKGVSVPEIPKIMGYKEICELFEMVTAHAKNSPYLIFSEDLGERPLETVSLFCRHVGIPFKPELLTWENLGSQFTGQKWRDGKVETAVQYWHGDAIRSTCFSSLRTAEVDREGNPTFVEIENREDRMACRDLYLQSLPYYTTLKERWESSKRRTGD